MQSTLAIGYIKLADFSPLRKQKFIIYQEQDWQIPKEWKNSNVTVDIIQNLYYN